MYVWKKSCPCIDINVEFHLNLPDEVWCHKCSIPDCGFSVSFARGLQKCVVVIWKCNSQDKFRASGRSMCATCAIVRVRECDQASNWSPRLRLHVWMMKHFLHVWTPPALTAAAYGRSLLSLCSSAQRCRFALETLLVLWPPHISPVFKKLPTTSSLWAWVWVK